MLRTKITLTTDAGVQKTISNPFAPIKLEQVAGKNDVVIGNIPASAYAKKHKESLLYDAGILRVPYVHQFARANAY